MYRTAKQASSDITRESRILGTWAKKLGLENEYLKHYLKLEMHKERKKRSRPEVQLRTSRWPQKIPNKEKWKNRQSSSSIHITMARLTVRSITLPYPALQSGYNKQLYCRLSVHKSYVRTPHYILIITLITSVLMLKYNSYIRVL